MRLIVIILLFLSVYVVCYSQYFEGEIIYKNAFTSKIPNVTGEQMGKIMGTTQNYFIKDGNYKSFVDGTSIIMQQFDSKTNRLYNKTNNSDTLFWFDASINTDEVINFEIIKNKEKILGFDCDALVLHTKSGTTTFYYSSKYMVATKYYTNHNYGNWNYFINKSQSLPLKIVVENKQLVMESVAMEIKSMDLGDMYFNIPFTVPIKQSK